MPERLSYDHIPPGTAMEEADAEVAYVDTFGDGQAVLIELADGTQLVFRGDELRDRIAPESQAEAA